MLQSSHVRRFKSSARGFTLVEILIVVIILGILAAIVIPQFTNASTDARKSSTVSQLQTLRSAIELFKVQHNDIAPDLAGNQWAQLLSKTNVAGAVDNTATGIYGPYLESTPKNPLNGLSAVAIAPAVGIGWVVVQTPFTDVINATNQTPTLVYDEVTGTVQ